MKTISNIKALGFTWQTRDPFLFCVHHKDDYPAGNGEGRVTEVTLIAGKLGQSQAPEPSPDSWAFEQDNEVAIWIIKMEPRARWTLPGASSGMNRSLYFYGGGIP